MKVLVIVNVIFIKKWLFKKNIVHTLTSLFTLADDSYGNLRKVVLCPAFLYCLELISSAAYHSSGVVPRMALLHRHGGHPLSVIHLYYLW